MKELTDILKYSAFGAMFFCASIFIWMISTSQPTAVDDPIEWEVYTSDNIYYISFDKMEVRNEVYDTVYRFNDIRVMIDFISDRTASETSAEAKYWRCMDTAYANNEYRGCDTNF